MRDVAVVAFAQTPAVAKTNLNSVELLMQSIDAAIEMCGIERRSIGFTVHGSSDYLTGQPFSFVAAVDAIGAWPPIVESHVEMDGAWALYEAWVKIQTGECDTALVFANGKSSPGDLRQILPLQMDPYYVAPLGLDWHAVAALQARALIDAGLATERDFAEIAAAAQRCAYEHNPLALRRATPSADELLHEPYVANPLRAHDCPPVTDATVAVVLAAGDTARSLCSRPAWIRAIDHRIDIQGLGFRDLTTSPSAALAARQCTERAGAGDFDVVEFHAPYSSQHTVLERELGLFGRHKGAINPSGGALAADPVMATGLIRIGEVARRIWAGEASRGLAHATQGPCLQQNLVCILEGE